MKHEHPPVYIEALENQLAFLKTRLKEPHAAEWRQLGKLAQEFTVWLERARPWISCASSLIAIRVEQVLGEVVPGKPCGNCLGKLSNLLEEAGRQLARPGSSLQVLDLQREKPKGPGSSFASPIILRTFLESRSLELPRLKRSGNEFMPWDTPPCLN